LTEKERSPMEEVEEIIRKARTFIEEGKSEEEVFRFLSPSLKKDPETTEKLADRLATLPYGVTTGILQHMLAETKEKRVRKTIKRSLYRLRAKGVSVREDSQDRRRSVLRPPQAEPPEGFGTGIDPGGHRLLILVIPHAGRGLTVMHAVIGDTHGLVDFTGAEMTRKEFKSFFETLQGESFLPLIKMEASYVGLLFSRAYHLTLEKKGTPPQDYLHLKSEIERVKKEHEKPLIYGYLSREELEGDDRWLRRGGDLLNDELYMAWIIEEDKIRPYAEALRETQESKLFLNQSQKEARFQEIYLKAVSELFSEEWKRLYQRRLEETAYILNVLGKEEEARTALSVAIELEKPLNPIQPNPFLLQLVIKSIYHLMAEDKKREEKESSLIVAP
jgi:hypothetical protein